MESKQTSQGTVMTLRLLPGELDAMNATARKHRISTNEYVRFALGLPPRTSHFLKTKGRRKGREATYLPTKTASVTSGGQTFEISFTDDSAGRSNALTTISEWVADPEHPLREREADCLEAQIR